MPKGKTLFTFFAGISGLSEDLIPEQIQVDASLQEELSEMFEEQAAEFLRDDCDRVPFDPKANYRLERGQVFVIKEFDLPLEYVEAVTKPHQADVFAMGRKPQPHVATIFAGELLHAKDKPPYVKRLLFQQFRSPQLLDRRFTLFWDRGVFNRVANDGLTLAHELAAIWVGGNLYFRSFSIVSRFFDLGEFEPKATVEEIASFVENSLFVFENDGDSKAVFHAIESDDFLRRRVASIQSKDILSLVKPMTAAKKAKDFGIEIDVKRPQGKGSKIALPKTKKELKAVVKFLNEEYFHGELTAQLYETNSLRRLNP
ncbi:hypothetical protein [Planctellipticum variicoloris]|uniref:hypothetical protein n=1 Tax=Planctellipticum variicoloris TaxID=3064265 RepID=UPI0030134384|nr:hypothetical protein SH412_002972 [Planctomycetaceae bacterium SH412]